MRSPFLTHLLSPLSSGHGFEFNWATVPAMKRSLGPYDYIGVSGNGYEVWRNRNTSAIVMKPGYQGPVVEIFRIKEID